MTNLFNHLETKRLRERVAVQMTRRDPTSRAAARNPADANVFLKELTDAVTFHMTKYIMLIKMVKH